MKRKVFNHCIAYSTTNPNTWMLNVNIDKRNNTHVGYTYKKLNNMLRKIESKMLCIKLTN